MNDLICSMPREEVFHSGHPLCPGCAGGVMMRWIGKALGKETVATISASCITISTSVHPTSLEMPCLYISMASSPGGITGVSAALRVLKRKNRFPSDRKVNVIAVAGDGSTGDIGMASLSGAAERNDDGIYFCFDNEAYMNTGIQRSGATPQNCWTTSTLDGKKERKKDLPLIMAAHHIPYVATASIAFPDDFFKKMIHARDMGPGFKYIHVYSPCPAGWRFSESKTVEMARLGVETGFWMLYEVEQGQFRPTYLPEKRRPVEEFLRSQGRFSKMTKEQINEYQKNIDERFKAVEEKCYKDIFL